MGLQEVINMYRKFAGDDIAMKFQQLMNKKIEKKAEYHSEENPVADNAEDHGDTMMDMAKDIMATQVDEAIDDMAMDDMGMDDMGMDDMVMDENSKEARIMRGLGKIAASLKAKGEVFASDVVEATAISINKDLRKESAKKNSVCTELQKIARNMRVSGDNVGADAIEASMIRIKNT